MKKQKKEIYVAWHEAGHSVVAWRLFGLKKIKKITIKPKEDYLGMVEIKSKIKKYELETESYLVFEYNVMNEIIELYAGTIAEKKIRKRANNVGASSDFELINKLHLYFFGSQDDKLMKYLLDYLYRKAELLIEQNWEYVEAIAKELLEKKEMRRDDVLIIIDKVFDKKLKSINNKVK